MSPTLGFDAIEAALREQQPDSRASSVDRPHTFRVAVITDLQHAQAFPIDRLDDRGRVDRLELAKPRRSCAAVAENFTAPRSLWLFIATSPFSLFERSLI
jgi:hypothetical protein